MTSTPRTTDIPIPNDASADGPVTTVSFFRYSGFRQKYWVFRQMGLANRPLARTPQIGFSKLMGTGSEESFNPRPNLSVYAILATWPSLEAAHQSLHASKVFSRFRRRADENWDVYLQTVHARGLWHGGNPFEEVVTAQAGAPVAVLTRGKIRTKHLRDFWKAVPKVSDATATDAHMIFKMGMGDVPLVQQVTFSIWPDPASVTGFAYRGGAHAVAMREAKDNGWFSEDLYARFSIIAAEGRWQNGDPLESLRSQTELPANAAAAE